MITHGTQLKFPAEFVN